MNRLVEHPAACEDTPELIEHVLERYHETHRRELPELVALAEKVERVHGTDPNAPHGLADALRAIVSELEVHMRKEELVLFPAMKCGRADAVAGPIAAMRHDHGEQEQALARIAAITHGFRPAEGRLPLLDAALRRDEETGRGSGRAHAPRERGAVSAVRDHRLTPSRLRPPRNPRRTR